MTTETHEFTPMTSHTLRLQDTDVTIYYDDEDGVPYVSLAVGDGAEPITMEESEVRELIKFWGTYGRKVQTT